MSEFETTLRDQVAESLRTLETAQRAGRGDEAHQHGARIRDLLDVAARHGIDTDGWVDPVVLDSASSGE